MKKLIVGICLLGWLASCGGKQTKIQEEQVASTDSTEWGVDSLWVEEVEEEVTEEAAEEVPVEIVEEASVQVIPVAVSHAPVAQAPVQPVPVMAMPCDLSLWVQQLVSWCQAKGMQCITTMDEGDCYIHVYGPYKKEVLSVGKWCVKANTNVADLAAEITKMYAYCEGFAACFEKLIK